MALQSSGTMTTDDVEGELDKTSFSTHGAEELALIGKSAGDTVVFPTDFYDKSAPGPEFDDAIITVANHDPLGTGYARITLFTDGSYTTYSGPVPSETGHWYNPVTTSIGSGYRVKFTKISGFNPTTGTLGTWQALSSSRAIGLETSGDLDISGTYVMEIADNSSTTVLATSTITITVSGAGSGGPGPL